MLEDDLFEFCKGYLIKNISSDNISMIYKFARNNLIYMYGVKSYIDNKFKKITEETATKTWPIESMIEISDLVRIHYEHDYA